MECLFCNIEREKIDPGAKEYICSNCTQILMHLSQNQLKKGYDLATEKEYCNKAKTIKSFLEVDNINEQQTRPVRNGTRFSFNRTRATRFHRNNKSQTI